MGANSGSMLDLILDLILDLNFVLYFAPHFGPNLPTNPHKMRVPQEIRRRLMFDVLECFILELFLDTFLDAFWEVLRHDGGRKNMHIK